MDRVFDVYLAKKDQPESDACAELSLPAAPYQMQDAFDKLRLAEGDALYWEITEYHQFEELSTLLDGSCGLYNLNALAQKLSELDERQCTAFAGLLKIEQKKNQSVPISRLVNMAYSTGCCHVVDEALNDSQLGRFCAENGFVPGVDELPDAVFELLDFERIGREHRQREGGVLAALDVRDWRGTSWRCLDCRAPTLTEMISDTEEGIDSLNRLAQRLADMEPQALTAYKALLEAVNCQNLQSAEQLMDTMDQYTFSPQYSSPIGVARGELSVILRSDEAARLTPHLNLYQYGQELIQRYGGALTGYDLLERKDGQPIQAMEIQPQQGGMEMM